MGRARRSTWTARFQADIAQRVADAAAFVNPATGEVERELGPEEVGVLRRWSGALRECGEAGVVQVCEDGHARVCTRCCHAKPCPRHQRRLAEQAVRRGVALYQETHAHRPEAAPAKAQWFLLTLATHGRGRTLEQRTEDAIELRAAWWKRASKPRRVAGRGTRKRSERVLGGWGAIELGTEGSGEHVHVHFVCYGGWQARDEWQSWLRARDCTRERCPHPADDRCEDCQAARRACTHPDGERERCNGSWVVDVRALKAGKRGRTAEDGFREALKYACAPVLSNYDPEQGATLEELAYVHKTMRFLLAIRGRHRTQAYGIARKPQKDERNGEDVEAGPDAGQGCPVCGGPMRDVEGWVCSGTDWRLVAPAVARQRLVGS